MKSYDRVAWCTELSPADQEFFEEMKADGIDTAVVCVHTTGSPEPLGMEQTYTARGVGMNVHAFCMVDLVEPEMDALRFANRLKYLNYHDDCRLAIMPLPDVNLEAPEERIKIMFECLRKYRPGCAIDIVLTKDQLINGEIVFDLLPDDINLTIGNTGGLNAGIKEAGTWIYTAKFHGRLQLLAYDFYQYYTKANQFHGFQLGLDNKYEARMGDSWWIIAKQHGLQVLDLLELNHADIADRIIPGQRIRIA